MRCLASFIAKNEFWLLWIYGAPLLLSSSLPMWLLAGSLATIPLFWLTRRVSYRRWSRATPLDLPLLLLIIMGLVGVVVSIDQVLSWRLYLELLGGVGLYYGLVNGIRHPEGANDSEHSLSRVGVRFDIAVWIVIGLTVSMGVVGWLGLRDLNKFLPLPQGSDYLPWLNFSALNPRGFTPNIVAGTIAPIIPLGVGFALSQPSRRRFFLFGVSALLLGILGLTQSRGAVIGVGLGLGLMMLWWQRKFLWAAPVLGIGIIVLFILTVTTDLADAVFAGDSLNTASSRLELWSRALYMLQDFPFTGIGLGTFERIVRSLYPLFVNSAAVPLPHAHNLYLQMGLDYGVPGLVAFIGLSVTTLAIGFEMLRRSHSNPREWLVAGLVAGYVVYLVHGLFDAVAVSTKVGVVVWFLVALLMALYLNPRRANPSEDLLKFDR